MFAKAMQKTKEIVLSGKFNLYIRIVILTLVLVSTLTMSGTALAFGPMPGGVGG